MIDFKFEFSQFNHCRDAMETFR